ncbi:MAG: Coat domain protein, partial [Neobacillus sp.]|nr:Coat domain protein [Neobacillus sp.]
MEPIKPFDEKLTSTEIGKLWVIYGGNTMSKCVLSYFLVYIDDEEVRKVVENALNLTDSILQSIKQIFIKEKFPIPIGLTEEDVNLDAPRLFSDEFYLYYLRYSGKVGLNIYSIAIPIMTREDVRDFFIKTLNSTIKLITEVNDLLNAKGLLMKPPCIPIPEKVDFVKKQNFLNGYFGDIRPLHALEIAHLYDNIDNNVTSKSLLISFSQVAKNKKIREFFIRGKEITNKHIEICSQQLHEDNLPSPPLLDHLVSESTISPFSDKLMLIHKIDMFSMKIRTYSNAVSLNGRRDLGGMYAKLLTDIGLYVEDGANILIDQGWMEQPPQTID